MELDKTEHPTRYCGFVDCLNGDMKFWFVPRECQLGSETNEKMRNKAAN